MKSYVNSIYITTFAIVSMALSSCVTSLNTKKVMGVKPGEKVKTVTRTKMVIGSITPFGAYQDSVKLMPLSKSITYGKDIGRIPIGHDVEIRKVKLSGYLHHSIVVAKLNKKGVPHEVIIDGNDVEEILGVDYSTF